MLCVCYMEYNSLCFFLQTCTYVCNHMRPALWPLMTRRLDNRWPLHLKVWTVDVHFVWRLDNRWPLHLNVWTADDHYIWKSGQQVTSPPEGWEIDEHRVSLHWSAWWPVRQWLVVTTCHICLSSPRPATAPVSSTPCLRWDVISTPPCSHPGSKPQRTISLKQWAQKKTPPFNESTAEYRELFQNKKIAVENISVTPQRSWHVLVLTAFSMQDLC